MPYRPTPKTEAARFEARERIVAAAIEQLAAGGYASATVQSVARRAGVATGSVYRHFDSKSSLFAEAFRRAASIELDVFADVTADDGRPPGQRIGAAVEAFARRSLAEPTRAYALLAEPVDPAVEAERLIFRQGYRDVLKAVMEDGIARGQLPPHDTDTVSAALVGAIGEALVGPLSPANGIHGGSGRVSDEVLRLPGSSPEALIATLVEFCIRALPRPVSRRRIAT